MKYLMRIQCLFLLLMISLPATATEVPPHIARGHLLAAFCGASPVEKPKQITAIFREIMPVAAPHGSYTTVAFKGGYVGLTGNNDGKNGTTINFSIWGKDASELEPADKKYGTIRTRQFTHEGTGWAGRLAYPWKVGTRYQVFVHVKHEDGQTIFSAWFGSVEKNEWLLAGRTKKHGIHYLGHAGGFLEHAGTKNMQAPRSTGYGKAWVHNSKTWLPCTEYKMSLKDPNNARFFQKDNMAFIEIGLGIKSTEGNKKTYLLEPGEMPKLPEGVNCIKLE